MSRQFLLKKLEVGFEGFDANGDQILSEEDFVMASERLVTAFGLTPQSPEAKQLRTKWEDVWTDFIQPLDSDGDGRVTCAEFTQGFAAGLSDDPDGYRRRLAPIIDLLMDIADRDRDGKLSRDEFVIAYKAILGRTDEALGIAFDHLDADADGYITGDEWHQAVREYWGGEDENARGNWLLGPLPA